MVLLGEGLDDLDIQTKNSTTGSGFHLIHLHV